MKKKNFLNHEAHNSVYANLLTDYMFKRVYGNKEVLLAFLNMILSDIEIHDLEYLPTEALGNTAKERKANYDIKCLTTDGKIFIVEMQLARQKHFIDRSLYYTSLAINQQANYANDNARLNNKEWEYALDPVIFIAFINFVLPHKIDFPANEYISEYILKETKTGETMTQLQRYIFIELPRFSNQADQCISELEKWVYSMRHMHKLKDKPSNFNEKALTKLYELSKVANFGKMEYQQYMDSLMFVSDYKNTIDYAREEGREEGKAAIIQDLIASGMSAEQIAGITKMSVEQVKQHAEMKIG